MFTECELQFIFVKKIINRKYSLEEAFKNNIVPFKRPIKKAELIFNCKAIKINQTMEVSVYERNCLPRNT